MNWRDRNKDGREGGGGGGRYGVRHRLNNVITFSCISYKRPYVVYKLNIKNKNSNFRCLTT